VAAQKIQLPIGEHKFKVTFTKADASKTSEFTFKIEEGGIISG
jgi:hypothetical protein